MPIKDKRLALAIGAEFAEYNLVLAQLKTCSEPILCNEYKVRLKELAQDIITIVKGLCSDANSQCGTLLHEICWLSVEDWTYNINIPGQQAIQEDYLATVDGINKVVDPIWRPNTKYYIAFTVKDIVDDVDTPEGTFNYHYGFKTAGTIGHYHNAPNVNYGGERNAEGKLLKPEQYPLTSLEQYIDYNRSYPNADGNLLRSKPLFYSNEQAELRLFYIKPYVAHMFKNTWETYGDLEKIETTDSDGNNLESFKVFVQDPVSNIIMEHPMPPEVDTTTIPQTTEEWTADENAPIPPKLQFIQNFVEAQGGNCDFVRGDKIIPARQYTTVTFGDDLKPRKMYTAIITNAFNGTRKRVHDYVFQTSRYESFKEQIHSYILDAENDVKAIFTIDLDLNTQKINDVYTIVTETSAANNTQETEFIDSLDRVLEGIFRIPPLDPPVTTEFNIIKNGNTNDTVAILIRNPEPFNDPKIPLEVINGTDPIVNLAESTDADVVEVSGTINVLKPDGSTDAKYKMLFSKDYSQVLIMHNTKKITDSNMSLRFRYTNWSGSSYTIKDDLYNSDSTSSVKAEITINTEN
ncbi:hypothetical protein [Kordia sp.]|uniref:hypothetical protein n=1 Tax=Kordia sp. TaxID=1965332 RepID=UPI003D2D872F